MLLSQAHQICRVHVSQTRWNRGLILAELHTEGEQWRTCLISPRRTCCVRRHFNWSAWCFLINIGIAEVFLLWDVHRDTASLVTFLFLFLLYCKTLEVSNKSKHVKILNYISYRSMLLIVSSHFVFQFLVSFIYLEWSGISVLKLVFVCVRVVALP